MINSQVHRAILFLFSFANNLLSCHQLEIGIEEITGSRKKCNRVRRPIFMCKVWGQQEDERVKVSFNDKGQPIFNNSILSRFLGTLARNGKYAPLHYKSWPKMPQVDKDDMFALVLQKFDFCAGHKRRILRPLSKKWKNWKAIVKRDHFDSDLPIEEQIHSPPDLVQADQWKELIKYWHGDAKKKMKELSRQVPEGELDSSGPNDVFSQAMGKEKSGSVCMYGLEVRDYVNLKSVANPTDVVGKGRIASTDPSTEFGGEELGVKDDDGCFMD
ncbi:hypothetical protein RHMOL_Rhmol10G0251800 [Rhododendron molle]|uniref:Uncharacterized protein n=1 Tax=Rhododendron molle TaxID=49168 RepID=A0ACC0M6B4_RHOML|nr:hypothetical protein RHMOL_Rhmol10G0251800 [Rhododendron molle]